MLHQPTNLGARLLIQGALVKNEGLINSAFDPSKDYKVSTTNSQGFGAEKLSVFL